MPRQSDEPRGSSQKRKQQTDGEEPRKARKNLKRRKKAASAQEEEDKLDKLIAQYRSKFIPRGSDTSKDGASSGQRIRRWFETS